MGIVQSSASGSTYLIVTMDMEVEWKNLLAYIYFLCGQLQALHWCDCTVEVCVGACLGQTF